MLSAAVINGNSKNKANFSKPIQILSIQTAQQYNTHSHK